MKTLVNFIIEGKKKTINTTFGKFFCWYEGIKSINDYSEDKFDDYGYLWNEDIEDYQEFFGWAKEHKNDKITVTFDDFDKEVNHGRITCKLDDSIIDLDWTGNIEDIDL